ncbi:LacI family DNA-binding transcriptional regulator [Paenibacillus sp. LHD-117]|uniref:LacI family DNA-binding transcriptional regulator n=1 Tax=Paenibacillus sp. LHD-117 TaxID=3071412 RepID=UPI0027E1DD07|nr:LacI family DNA-binding transcriptional regulator [Paenibacillus sp. LHD-117]MDQ6422409.1 LacI family DNA-binding transcriptional regulator [Paenibacillus sp. LHD-117]
MPRKKQVTLQTIADGLGLTIHTVSKALRGLPGMSEATRKTVVDRARELGYRTKDQEAGIMAERIPWANAKPRRFAMLIVGDSAFHRMQLEGVQIRLNELGHSLYPLLVPSVISGRAGLEDWLDKNGLFFADGLFLTAAIPEWMETVLLELPIPKVLVNYPPDLAEVDSVIWDVEYAIHQSMEELYRAGHRRILYVGDIEPLRGFRLRWKAFSAASERLGLHGLADPEEHVTSGSADRAAWMEKLSGKLSSEHYTAVVSAIPDMSEWVYVAAGFLKLDIPRSFSLVGLEHEEHPRYPGMSRPRLLVREAGERAAELMLRRIANPLLPFEHVRLRGSFYQGKTILTLMP